MRFLLPVLSLSRTARIDPGDFPRWNHGRVVEARVKAAHLDGSSLLRIVSHPETTEQLEAYTAHGKQAYFLDPKLNQVAQGKLTPAFEAITPAAFNTTIRAVVDAAPSRCVFNSGNAKARTFLIKILQKLGYTVEEQEFDIEGKKAANILARLGSGPVIPAKQDWVLLGAHYDSLPCSGEKAPGADDNASGVAVILLAAEAMKKKGLEAGHSAIVLALFTGEEQGLLGSSYFVEHMPKEHFKGAIVMDQVGYAVPGTDDSVIFETQGDPASDRAPDRQKIIDALYQTVVSDKINKAEVNVNYSGWGSDHVSFLKKKLPAVLLISRDNLASATKFGHRPLDKLDNINPHYGALMARIAVGAAYRLALPHK